MTLSASTGYQAISRELFGFAPLINFADAASNTDRTAFDFTSPNSYYLCEMQPGIDTNGMASGDILSFSLQGNGNALYQTKWALSSASEPVQFQLPGIKFILPKLTILKAIFNMQSGTGMIGSATCMFRGVEFA